MNRLKCLVISVLFVLSALFFNSPLSRAQEKKNLRIVFVSLSWNNQLPYRIAIAKGFFKDQGLSIEQIAKTKNARR
jgi:ABC-type nitrate/sulfonate/bicarbonate transport system substrate-binding protein